MTREEFQDILLTSDYDFIRNNEHLGMNTILLTLGGSYAYGTNVETSDLDIRGCALNRAEDILLQNSSFEQFTDNNTDTVIYSFNKLIKLLCNCNPNTIEILGCRPMDYLYLNDVGQLLLDNRKMFLSKKAVNTFGGYATAQLHRLNNKAIRKESAEELEAHIFKILRNIQVEFPDKYASYNSNNIKLYIDDAVNKEYKKEIFMDINLHHYPLRDYKSMWSEMNEVVKSYAKIGTRNSKAIEHNKLGKHMMHLIRLYYMCIDILEKEEIITYRRKEHDLLMDIRNGKYLKDNKPTEEFFEMVKGMEDRMQYAAENTSLPDKPDYKKINEFVYNINKGVVLNENN